MSVKVNINEHVVMAHITQLWERGLEMLSSEILKDCNLYVKMDKHGLEDSSYDASKLKQGLLIWETPYAARQYYEIQTAYTDVNPRATWRWVDVAKQRHYKDWTKSANNLVRYYKP